MNILKQFYKLRPAVSPVRFAKEVGISYEALKKIAFGRTKPRPETMELINKAMKKYGYKPKKDDKQN